MRKTIAQPIPDLPSWCALATTLSFYGWYDEVLDLLQHMSKTTRAYGCSSHLATLRCILSHSKFLPRSYGLPNVLQSKRVKRTSRINKHKHSGSCNDVRDYLLRTWEHSKVHECQQLCKVVVDTYWDARKPEQSTIIAMLIQREHYQFNPLV